MGRWSETQTVSSIPERFSEQAARRPDHPAIAGISDPLTYGELASLVDRYAARLAPSTGPGERVALLLSHDGPLVAAALGALRCGAAVLTLNANEPAARLQQLARAADVGLIVTDQRHRERALAVGLGPDRTIEVGPTPDAGPIRTMPTASDLAFLISTSGSTGKPKVVMQTHGNMLHNVLRYTNGLGITDQERVAWLASLSGGQGLATVWSTLLNGATLCPFPIGDRGVTGLAAWLTEHRISVFDTLPSILRNFSRTLGDHRISGPRLVRLASEPGLRSDFDAFQRHFDAGCQLASVLASSEAGIIAQAILDHDADPADGRLPVGQPAEGLTVTLMEGDEPVPDPAAGGEIVIAGEYLSPGYWRDEQTTAARFELVAGRRRFRTGDLARCSAAGLVVLGRIDGQVKVRGHRLQLEEVEGALLGIDEIAAACVAVRTTARGDARLTAYVVPAAPGELDAVSIRRELSAELAPHAIPSAFVTVSAFPLNAHGKVDRDALAQIEPPQSPSGGGGEPLSSTGAWLRQQWSAALEIDGFGPQQGFLELGGDSLTAAVIAAAVHDRLGVELRLDEFARNPTVTALAERIDRTRRAVKAEDEPGPTPVERAQPIPLSFAQEAMWPWVISKGAGFNLAIPYRIRGPLDLDALHGAIGRVVARHEILRTTFHQGQAQPFQVPHHAEGIELSLTDLRGEPDPTSRAAELVAREAQQPFDVAARPPIAFHLIAVGEDEHQLLIVSHHLVCDALSWRIFFEQLATEYRGPPVGPDPASSLQYADYAVWDHTRLRPDSRHHENELRWWMTRFADAPPPVRLPFTRDQPAESPGGDGVLDWGLDQHVAAGLDRLGQGTGATNFMTRLAVFTALVGLETETRDIVLNTYVTTRRHVVLQGMLGPFINRALLRLRFDPNQSFADLLTHVRATVLELSANSSIPFERLWPELRRRGVSARFGTTKFEAHYSLPALAFDGLELEPLRRSYVEPWGFTLGVDRRRESDRCRAVFDPRLHDQAGVQRFLDRLKELAELVLGAPGEPLHHLHTAVEA